MTFDTNTSFNNLFSDKDIFNQQEQTQQNIYGSEDIVCRKDEVCKFMEEMEKRVENVENALFAATKQREQIITLLQDLSTKILFIWN